MNVLSSEKCKHDKWSKNQDMWISYALIENLPQNKLTLSCKVDYSYTLLTKAFPILYIPQINTYCVDYETLHEFLPKYITWILLGVYLQNQRENICYCTKDK